MRAEVRDYWEHNTEHEDQYFYVGFALLASSIHNYAVGRDLDLVGKRDWSATAYYYSMVHSGRLAVFLAYGDYPKGHELLARAFENETSIRKKRDSWFANFVQGEAPCARETFSRSELVTWYSRNGMGCTETDRILAYWARALKQCKALREDSNYEPLLIAHKHNHQEVTDAFDQLCRSLREIAERVLTDAVRFFEAVIHNSPRQQHWLAYLNHDSKPVGSGLRILDHEGFLYIEDSLSRMSQDENSVQDAMRLLSPLRFPEAENPTLADEVNRNILLGVFGGKKDQMEQFKKHIKQLIALAEGVPHT